MSSQVFQPDDLITEALPLIELGLAENDGAAVCAALDTIVGLAVTARWFGVVAQAYRVRHAIERGQPRADVDFAVGALLFEVRAASVRAEQHEQATGEQLAP